MEEDYPRSEIYNSHATVPAEKKLFRTVRIADPSTRPAETLRLLSKGQLQDHLIDQYWKSEFVDRQVGEALRALFAPGSDPAVIRLVHGKLPSMPRADIKASLGRLRSTFDFPVVSPPAVHHEPARPAAAAVTPAKPPKGSPEAPKAVGAGTPWRHVTLGQLIDTGLLHVPMEISHRYRGTDLRARIESADRIDFDGAPYDSLSIAGGMARKTIMGETPGRAYPQTNGWTFWEFRASDGSLRPLDTLRRELHERKVVSLEGRRTG